MTSFGKAVGKWTQSYIVGYCINWNKLSGGQFEKCSDLFV